MANMTPLVLTAFLGTGLRGHPLNANKSSQGPIHPSLINGLSAGGATQRGSRGKETVVIPLSGSGGGRVNQGFHIRRQVISQPLKLAS